MASLHMPPESGTAPQRRTVLHALGRMIAFPPFLALVAGLCLLPLGLADWLEGLLRRLGDMVTPLALISVGAQLRIAGLGGIKRPLLAGLGFKLMLAPLLLTVLLVGLLGQGGERCRLPCSRRPWDPRSALPSSHSNTGSMLGS